ncbi:MAG: DUF4126 domain-containing protein [Verrucomicrobiae bacterium]|nr:DUF4126 domain-containing protein [Verrucomicrobiae bacterium]
MDILNQLAVALGFATLAGLNLYLTVFITGLAIRMDWVQLSSQYDQLGILGSDAVLIAAGIFFALEFFSDKIPWVDSLWDGIHTLIRPVGGGLLAIQTLGTTEPAFDVVIGLLAGSTTLLTHGFKAGTRLAVNTSPEPFSNIVVSTAEDVAVVGGLALMAWNPLVAAVVFLAFLGFVLYATPRLFRRSKAFLWLATNKLGSFFRGGRADDEEALRLYARLSSDDDLALADALGGGLVESDWSAKVLAAKTKGFRGINSYTFGKIVAVSGSPGVIHFVGRRFFKSFHCPVPLADMAITQEPRFLSEDVVLYSRDGARKLILKLPAGRRVLAERIVESLLQLGAAKGRVEDAAESGKKRREPAIEIEAEVVKA